MTTAAPAPLGTSAWSRQAKIALCTLALISALGVWLRSLGYFDGQNGLWWDEASWVRRILAGKYGIRPVGYGAFSRFFLQRDLAEWTIRFPSYLAGILTAPVSAWLFRRAGLSWAATCLGAFVLAVHPWAVAYAKEFKPYAFDLLFHAAVAGAGASYLRNPNPRRLAALCAVVLVAPLFSWTVAALYPGLLVVVLLSQRARKARGEFIAVAVMSTLAVAGAVTIYVTRLSGRKLSAGYWAKKYGVFFEGDDANARFGWIAEQTWDLARFPGRLESAFGSPDASELVFGTALGLLAVLGFFTIVKKRDWVSAALWVCPWLVVLAVHLVGVWPYGVFRTNLFFLLYPLGLSLLGFDEFVRLVRRRATSPRLAALGPALAGTAMLAFLPYAPSRFVIKSKDSGALSTSTRQVLLELRTRKLAAGTPIILDAHACASWAHYTRRDPDFKYLRSAVRRMKVSCLPARRDDWEGRLKRALRRSDAWVYFGNSRDPLELLADIRKLCRVAEWKTYPTGDLLVSCLSPKKARAAPDAAAPTPTPATASSAPDTPAPGAPPAGSEGTTSAPAGSTNAPVPVSTANAGPSPAPLGSPGVAPPQKMD